MARILWSGCFRPHSNAPMVYRFSMIFLSRPFPEHLSFERNQQFLFFGVIFGGRNLCQAGEHDDLELKVPPLRGRIHVRTLMSGPGPRRGRLRLWIRAPSRLGPDPLAVHRFAPAVVPRKRARLPMRHWLKLIHCRRRSLRRHQVLRAPQRSARSAIPLRRGSANPRSLRRPPRT